MMTQTDGDARFEKQAPIVIIGAGLAGLFTALKLAPLPVLVISPTRIGEGASSFWAQGGIAAAIGEGDLPEKHVADTIKAGCGLVDENTATLVANDAADRIDDLLSFGVPFDRDLEGRLALSREAAHSERRIVRVRGDMAGKAIMDALIQAVRADKNITIYEECRVIDLVKQNDRISGVVLSETHAPENIRHIPASSVVLATGGVGGLFAVTTNPDASSGEGLGMAARAGALIADAEFIQFHPTAINVGLTPAPLATEALRGEGAVLTDKAGRRFMPDYHDSAELAPRDVVARAVHDQITKGNGAFLDCTKSIGSVFPEHYPTVYEKCKTAGLDPVITPIPVAPAVHYHMGGVWTDSNGRTTIDGLWACGEVASTGMHGANRLASNSLLEAVVFAARIGENIKQQPQPVASEQSCPALDAYAATPVDHKTLTFLRTRMSESLGVIRNKQGLQLLKQDIDALSSQENLSHSLQNILAAARLMTTAALQRRESRGGHYRSDFPDTDPAQSKRTCTKLTATDNRIEHANEYA